jgi:phosphate transport system substrate-binding protein
VALEVEMRYIARHHFSIALIGLLLGSLASAARADELRMGGTTSVTKLLEKLGAICKPDTDSRIVVVPNLGGTGGIRALGDRMLDIAVAGRALRPEEAAKGLSQVASIQTPFGFVTSHARPDGLKSADIAEIYSSLAPSWGDGTPMRIVLRPQADSDTVLLAQHFPGMAAALDKARQRHEIPVAATDVENADKAESIPGSLTSASYIQIKSENRNLRFVALDGVEPSLENLERGTYRLGRRLHVFASTPPTRAAERFIACMRSPEGVQALRDAGGRLDPD